MSSPFDREFGSNLSNIFCIAGDTFCSIYTVVSTVSLQLDGFIVSFNASNRFEHRISTLAVITTECTKA